MTTQYSDWQQSVDGPDELSQEDQISEGMAELLDTYKTVPALATLLGVTPVDVLFAWQTGYASDELVAAMNRLANEVQP